MISKLGRPYAQAFLDSLGSTGAARDALTQLRTVTAAMEAVPRLQEVAANPAIPSAVKSRAVAAVADSLGLGQSVRRLLELLLENYRFSYLPEIVEAFAELLNRELGVVRATVKSAGALDQQQQRSLQEVLEEVSGSKVELDVSVDEELLGCFVATVGSKRYDTSIKGQIERMARALGSDSSVLNSGDPAPTGSTGVAGQV